MTLLYPTQEIGSLDKMGGWRRKGVTEAGQLSSKDWNELEHQRSLFEIDGDESPSDLDTILRQPQRSPEERRQVKEWSALFALKLFEKAGLTIVGSGEQFRSEMYQQPVSHIDGIEFAGWIRSWGNKYFKKGRVVAEPSLREPFHLDEFHFMTRHAEGKQIKVPITGAYTLADWSFDEYFYPSYLEQYSRREAAYRAKRDLSLALARNVLHPHLKALVEAGANYIQIDEPAAATKPEEVDIVVDAYNESVKDLDATFALHICFTNYDTLFPAVQRLENCDMFTWEYANRGTREFYAHLLGLIKTFTPDKKVGLGVIDVHDDRIESPEEIRDRILYASGIMGPEQIYVNPDCGLRTRSIDVAYQKLVNMTEGAERARQGV